MIEMDSWQADTVTMKRMTYQQALSWVEHHSGLTDVQTCLMTLRHLEIIRDETRIERFSREAGVEVTDQNREAIIAALTWVEKSRT
ncbi:hypothetical protein [Rhizorhabdus histidinilytica]|uniref:hypothetical protein n=1 Tax=Rhizorhabdus histidinilytica TaxID=439228 RepID=UPI0032203E8C